MNVRDKTWPNSQQSWRQAHWVRHGGNRLTEYTWVPQGHKTAWQSTCGYWPCQIAEKAAVILTQLKRNWRYHIALSTYMVFSLTGVSPLSLSASRWVALCCQCVTWDSALIYTDQEMWMIQSFGDGKSRGQRIEWWTTQVRLFVSNWVYV